MARDASGKAAHTTLLRARDLRRSPTDAEARLWASLRRGALAGLKFRRQQPFGRYILDFYCHRAKLVIELDGGSHFEPEAIARDSARTAYLQERGLHVLRFTNLEVLKHLPSVLETILREVAHGPSPLPSPRGRGGLDRATGAARESFPLPEGEG